MTADGAANGAPVVAPPATIRLAVVGRVNEGKSSIVSTLTEDDSVEVSEQARTTTRCRSYAVSVDGEELYVLVDTPGFGNAPRALHWMKQRARTGEERVRAVADFVREHRDRPEFRDECELLGPILEGAAILYVVDASHRFTHDFEAEMEILQWTGRPRLALLNRIGARDHTESWARVLDQYFKHHLPFNAHAVGFKDRIEILRTFGLLHPDWRAPLDRAVGAFERDWERRRSEAARTIGALLFDALSWTRTFEVDPAAPPEERKRLQQERAQVDLTEMEAGARTAVERLFHHDRLRRAGGAALALESEALFSEETWRRRGLTRLQKILALSGAGALTGGAIDLGVGGLSFGIGLAIGATVGAGLGVWREWRGLSWSDVLGGTAATEAQRREVTLGPVVDPGFPVVLLNRALAHYRLVRDRAHGRRDELSVPEDDRPMTQLPSERQKALSARFKSLVAARGKASVEDKTRIIEEVEGALRELPVAR